MRLLPIGSAALSMLGVLILTACTSSGTGTAGEATSSRAPTSAPTTTTSTTSTIAPTTSQPVSTILEVVPAPDLTSTGQITIGPTTFDFAFECYAAGAGDVLALGVGFEPQSGEQIEAIVQAFLGQPYVAVLVEDDVFELAVDRPAELFVQQSSIQGSALRFVASGDSAGSGRALGLGSVSISCDGFAPGLPEDYVTVTVDEEATAS